MHQDFSVYTKETLCTADLLEAVHQYSMQDIHGSAHTSNFTSLSTREGQFHNLNTLPPQSELTTQSTTTNANETGHMVTAKKTAAMKPNGKSSQHPKGFPGGPPTQY